MVFQLLSHHSSSGQVEVMNRGLKRILERTVGENCASWSDKLDDALWACMRFSPKALIRWISDLSQSTEVYPLWHCHSGLIADGSNVNSPNCHRLKHYYGGDTPPLVIPDLQTFPKDN
ncbi:reverse transcriptase domain-containing protein [Tanacetum coccineum]